MGIIQKHSIKSTIIIMAGFALGAFNLLVLVPKILTPEQLGLTRVITDAGLTLASLCTFGTISIIVKFFPFYRSYLKPEKNDLPFLTLTVCITGFVIMCTIGYFARDLIVKKFSERSPLFVEYSYLVYPYCFFMLVFIWLESFGWVYQKSVYSNNFREIIPRVIFTASLIFFAFQLISLHQFVFIFACSFALPSLLMLLVLRKTGTFLFNIQVSQLTKRFKFKMVSFGLFVFGAQFLNLLSRTIDTFILSAKSSKGLTDTAIFTIATYIVTLMEVPQRSINSAAVPILSESWKNKDIENIRNIYKKSVTNLLIIGLTMLGLIWLNLKNIEHILGKNYAGIELVILIMGIAKLIDLGTGANGQIIGTSNYWKVDFTTNVIYTLLALPLNYFLISKFGLIGAAVSNLISLTFYNVLRFGFLKYKFNLQPYVVKDLIAIVIAVFYAILCHYIPGSEYILVDIAIRSFIFLLLFVPTLYALKISPEINEILRNYLNALKAIIFRRSA